MDIISELTDSLFPGWEPHYSLPPFLPPLLLISLSPYSPASILTPPPTLLHPPCPPIFSYLCIFHQFIDYCTFLYRGSTLTTLSLFLFNSTICKSLWLIPKLSSTVWSLDPCGSSLRTCTRNATRMNQRLFCFFGIVCVFVFFLQDRWGLLRLWV